MTSSLSAFDILSFLMSCLHPFSKNADIKQSNFPYFILGIHIAFLVLSQG